ncbi:hypothetical protein MKL01_24900, partial [Methylobacterium sp. J-070]|nr:hypothetical protein [Methylobacterium sp. J-070]
MTKPGSDRDWRPAIPHCRTLELFLAEPSSLQMLHRGPAKVGDLQPIGVARHLTAVGRDEYPSSWTTISVSCLSTLALLAVGAAWLDRGGWIPPTLTRRPAPGTAVGASSPAIFPSWIEVPHLSGPASRAPDPATFALADRPRSFLDPNPAHTGAQPGVLAPRANPRLPLLGAPLDAARLGQEQPPAWDDGAERQAGGPSAAPAAMATLGLDGPSSSPDRAGPGAARTPPADLTAPPLAPSKPAQGPAPTEIVVRPPPPVAASPPSGRVATLGPDGVQPGVDPIPVMTLPRDAGVAAAPILNPRPARHARSLRRPPGRTPASRAPMPDRDTEQTASIISQPTSARGRIDAGAVAHASIHRGRANRPAVSPPASAPSTSWTLPSALA